VHVQKKYSAAQKASAAEKQLMKQESSVAFQQALNNFNSGRDVFIDKVAKANSKKPSYVRDLLLSKSKAVKPRKVNLQNALVHHVAKELNAS